MNKLLITLAATTASLGMPAARANTIVTDATFYGATFATIFDMAVPVDQLLAAPLRTSDLTAGGPAFVSFCIEPFIDLTALALGPGDPSYSAATLYTNAAVQNLFNGYFGNVLSSKQEAAAFQLALWELVADSGANLSTGAFVVAGLQSDPAAVGAIARATQMLGGVGAASGTYTLQAYLSGPSQDILTAVPIPEPATYGLMAAGLLLVGGVARRHRKSEQITQG